MFMSNISLNSMAPEICSFVFKDCNFQNTFHWVISLVYSIKLPSCECFMGILPKDTLVTVTQQINTRLAMWSSALPCHHSSPSKASSGHECVAVSFWNVQLPSFWNQDLFDLQCVFFTGWKLSQQNYISKLHEQSCSACKCLHMHMN